MNSCMRIICIQHDLFRYLLRMLRDYKKSTRATKRTFSTNKKPSLTHGTVLRKERNLEEINFRPVLIYRNSSLKFEIWPTGQPICVWLWVLKKTFETLVELKCWGMNMTRLKGKSMPVKLTSRRLPIIWQLWNKQVDKIFFTQLNNSNKFF